MEDYSEKAEQKRFEYTKQIHASMLKRIMSQSHPCDICPAFELEELIDVSILMRDCCPVCKGFIGLKQTVRGSCPCNKLGAEVCIERTRKALKENGYIK